MKSFARIAAVSGILLAGAADLPAFGAPSVVMSQPDGVADAQHRNAAVFYWRAFYDMDREFQRKSGDSLASDRTADWVPPAEVAQQLKQNAAAIDGVMLASRLQKCDFQVQYEDGFLATLPHLSPMRACVRVLAIDAHRAMSEGKPDEAAGRIAAMYRMANHVKSDKVLISSLVSIAIASLASHEVELFGQAGLLTDAGRAEILDAAQVLNTPDGFDVKKSLETERHLAVDYLRRNAKGPDAGKKLASLGLMADDGKMPQEILDMNEAALNKSLDDLDRYYVDLLKIWDAHDFEYQIKELTVKMERGDYGLLAKILAPSVDRCHVSARKAHDDLVKTIGILAHPSKNDPSKAK